MNLVSADLSFVSAAEAVACVRSGDRIFVHGAAMTPRLLVEALTDRDDLRDIELVHIHTEGRARYTEAAYASRFHANACFVGSNLRQAVQEGRADYIPVFLSEIPQLFRRQLLTPDVALIQVSPPDKHGYCSLGASVDVALAAVQTARRVVALVNPQVPRAHGDGFIHLADIHAAVWTDEPIYAFPPAALGETERQIGRQVASLVEDGATLQMGIGGVPDAVLAELTGHRNLGIHTEMFSDGIIGLIKTGAVTNSLKKVYPGKIVSSFVMGTQAVYDFLDDNPIVLLKDCSLTNDTSLIRKNPRVTAINSAIEIDLTGQICADTIGMSQYSGVGGQMDFIRGASLSEGGKPIIALSSVTSRGLSKIVPVLKPGAGVTTTRAHVHHVVTEYGVADLYGRNLRERARALIAIAHPDHQEYLEQAASERFRYEQ